MNKLYLDDGEQNIVKSVLQKFADRIIAVYAFGSRAKGGYKKFSDLDLAIKFGTNVPKDTILFIKDVFENSILTINVDVVDIDEISDDFKEAIQDSFVEIRF